MVKTNVEFPPSFFEEEDECGFHITKEIKELWAIELDLLNEFDKVCKKHNLTYFLDGGSILGAIRHKGFIPWDDDIDIIMMRDQYDKLMKVAANEFSEPYFFQSYKTDVNYTRGHCQLRNSNTCAMRPTDAKIVKYNQGIFIDIFVLDGMPDNQAELEELFAKKRKLKKIMSWITDTYSLNPVKKMVRVVRSNICKILYGSLEKVYEKCDNLCKQYSNDEAKMLGTIALVNSVEESYTFSKSCLDDAIMMEFENTLCPIPLGYDEILKSYYGDDYMTPKNIPSMHNAAGNLIINTEKSYKEVLREIL